jgi:hypothetical protein
VGPAERVRHRHERCLRYRFRSGKMKAYTSRTRYSDRCPAVDGSRQGVISPWRALILNADLGRRQARGALARDILEEPLAYDSGQIVWYPNVDADFGHGRQSLPRARRLETDA